MRECEIVGMGGGEASVFYLDSLSIDFRKTFFLKSSKLPLIFVLHTQKILLPTIDLYKLV